MAYNLMNIYKNSAIIYKMQPKLYKKQLKIGRMQPVEII